MRLDLTTIQNICLTARHTLLSNTTLPPIVHFFFVYAQLDTDTGAKVR